MAEAYADGYFQTHRYIIFYILLNFPIAMFRSDGNQPAALAPEDEDVTAMRVALQRLPALTAQVHRSRAAYRSRRSPIRRASPDDRPIIGPAREERGPAPPRQRLQRRATNPAASSISIDPPTQSVAHFSPDTVTGNSPCGRRPDAAVASSAAGPDVRPTPGHRRHHRPRLQALLDDS